MILHSEENCGYCGALLDLVRESRWDGRGDSHHYKQADCDKCGARNWKRVDFHGSGHDLPSVNRTIESIVSKVQEK